MSEVRLMLSAHERYEETRRQLVLEVPIGDLDAPKPGIATITLTVSGKKLPGVDIDAVFGIAAKALRGAFP